MLKGNNNTSLPLWALLVNCVIIDITSLNHDDCPPLANATLLLLSLHVLRFATLTRVKTVVGVTSTIKIVTSESVSVSHCLS